MRSELTQPPALPRARGTRSARSRLIIALLFAAAGVLHFVMPASYERIVPPWLPNAQLLVRVSGVAEMLGAIGVLLAPTRRAAGWGLIALLVAVFLLSAASGCHRQDGLTAEEAAQARDELELGTTSQARIPSCMRIWNVRSLRKANTFTWKCSGMIGNSGKAIRSASR